MLLLPQVDLVVAWTSVLVLDLRLQGAFDRAPAALGAPRQSRAACTSPASRSIRTRQDDDTRFTDWLLRQRQIVVHDALLTWNDELRDAPQLVLDHVMFRLEQHASAATGSAWSASRRRRSRRRSIFAAKFTATSSKDWREAKGRFYVRLDYADVAQWREWIPLLRPVESGKGALRVWFDFADGKRDQHRRRPRADRA